MTKRNPQHPADTVRRSRTSTTCRKCGSTLDALYVHGSSRPYGLQCDFCDHTIYLRHPAGRPLNTHLQTHLLGNMPRQFAPDLVEQFAREQRRKRRA